VVTRIFLILNMTTSPFSEFSPVKEFSSYVPNENADRLYAQSKDGAKGIDFVGESAASSVGFRFVRKQGGRILNSEKCCRKVDAGRPARQRGQTMRAILRHRRMRRGAELRLLKLDKARMQ
jgi:hypothetical protein